MYYVHVLRPSLYCNTFPIFIHCTQSVATATLTWPMRLENGWMDSVGYVVSTFLTTKIALFFRCYFSAFSYHSNI
uniref:Uncharacterized protein n=1 Tax=Anguilla anguilla TaxID=7936 RepID=A0A0E9VTG3_ANGAN